MAAELNAVGTNSFPNPRVVAMGWVPGAPAWRSTVPRLSRRKRPTKACSEPSLLPLVKTVPLVRSLRGGTNGVTVTVK
jgi:hypothetical protein